MDKATYQETIKKFIWVDGEKARDYIALQLVSEVGELLGGWAKRIVGKEISDEYLALEAGDICFFLAWICSEKNVFFSDITPTVLPNDLSWGRIAANIAEDTANALFFFEKDDRHRFIKNIEHILGWVLRLLPKPLEEILQMNIDKLEERYGNNI